MLHTPLHVCNENVRLRNDCIEIYFNIFISLDGIQSTFHFEQSQFFFSMQIWICPNCLPFSKSCPKTKQTIEVAELKSRCLCLYVIIIIRRSFKSTVRDRMAFVLGFGSIPLYLYSLLSFYPFSFCDPIQSEHYYFIFIRYNVYKSFWQISMKMHAPAMDVNTKLMRVEVSSGMANT